MSSSSSSSSLSSVSSSVSSRFIYWDVDGLVLLDQRLLPHETKFVKHVNTTEISNSIKSMLVRGAPAIGVAGAYGMALSVLSLDDSVSRSSYLSCLSSARLLLDSSRPTAVNLSWATKRLYDLAEELIKHTTVNIKNVTQFILQEAHQLAEDDVQINTQLSQYGASLVPSSTSSVFNILHHCNTGKLATVDYGTALGVIYELARLGRSIHVWVDETRPRLQGARLTAWELTRASIPFHLVADSAAGLLMYTRRVDMVLFGADRVAANGDTANKIGTYKVALCARENGIPVYACVPCSTIDLTTSTGASIEIENRNDEEVTMVGSERIAPEGCPVFNPAFDVTPYKFLTGIITEEGIAYPPFTETLREMKRKSEEKAKTKGNNRLQQYIQAAKAAATTA